MVWQGAEICEEGGGGRTGDSAAKDQQKSQCPYPKGKTPRLLQQSGGAPRSEKRRLHLQTA